MKIKKLRFLYTLYVYIAFIYITNLVEHTNQQESMEMQTNGNANQDELIELVLTTADDAESTEPSCHLDEMVLVVTLDCCIQEEIEEENKNQSSTQEEHSTTDNESLFDSAENLNYHNEILMTTTTVNNDLDNIENSAPKDNLDFPMHDAFLFDHSYANPRSADGKEEGYSNGLNDCHTAGIV